MPDSIAKPAEPVKEEDKGDFRKMAEQGWQQATIAAKGIASAAVTVGTALSENAHKAVEHNFGKEAEGVAQSESAVLAALRRTDRQTWDRPVPMWALRASPPLRPPALSCRVAMLFRAPKRRRAARQWRVMGSKDVALDEVNIYLLPIDEIQFRCS